MSEKISQLFESAEKGDAEQTDTLLSILLKIPGSKHLLRKYMKKQFEAEMITDNKGEDLTIEQKEELEQLLDEMFATTAAIREAFLGSDRSVEDKKILQLQETLSRSPLPDHESDMMYDNQHNGLFPDSAGIRIYNTDPIDAQTSCAEPGQCRKLFVWQRGKWIERVS